MFRKPIDWVSVCIYLGLLVIDIIGVVWYILMLGIQPVYKMIGIIWEVLLAVIVLNWFWKRSREMDR